MEHPLCPDRLHCSCNFLLFTTKLLQVVGCIGMYSLCKSFPCASHHLVLSEVPKGHTAKSSGPFSLPFFLWVPCPLRLLWHHSSSALLSTLLASLFLESFLGSSFSIRPLNGSVSYGCFFFFCCKLSSFLSLYLGNSKSTQCFHYLFGVGDCPVKSVFSLNVNSNFLGYRLNLYGLLLYIFYHFLIL